LTLTTTVHLHDGSSRYPPMVQVPGWKFGLEGGLVKPPSPEDLWDWYASFGGAVADDPDPSWGKIWDTASALALKIKETPKLVEKKRVVELGCGLGLVGLVAAKAGATKTILVDREFYALHCACSTAQLNGLAVGDLTSEEEDNFAAVSALSADFERAKTNQDVVADVVVASDVLYDSARAMDDLAAACHDILGRGNDGIALVADPARGRAFGARDAFLRAATRRGATLLKEDFLFYDGLEPTLLLTLQFPKNDRRTPTHDDGTRRERPNPL